jgi:hypothetical protein
MANDQARRKKAQCEPPCCSRRSSTCFRPWEWAISKEAIVDDNGAPQSSGRDSYLTIVLCAFVGIPVFVFLNFLTGTFHYFLWGRSFSQETAGEREEEELRAEIEEQEHFS